MLDAAVLDAPKARNILYVAPGLLLYALFVLVPIAASLALSFATWNGLSAPVFEGLGNYLRLFADGQYFKALRNNAAFVFFFAILPLTLGMVLAAMVSAAGRRERLVIRTLLFLPYIMPTAVLGIIATWLYNPAFGPLNAFLRAIGLGDLALPWLGNFTFALPAVGMVATWHFFGFAMVIFLTGMQRIDPSLFEAAKVDGAGAAQTFRYVTVPSLLPEVRIVLLLTTIASIKNFDLVLVMTRGGPGTATLVANLYMYDLGFRLSQYGYAAAVAIVGAVLVFLVNFVIQRALPAGK